MRVKAATVTAKVTISKPLNEVWQFLTDFTTMPKWARGVDSIIDITPGAVRVGTVVKDVGLGLGKKWDEQFEVDEFIDRKKIGLRWDGSYGKAYVRYSLKAVDGGTELRGTTYGDYRFPFWIILLFTKKLAQGNFSAGVNNIKQLLETGKLSKK